MTNEQYMKRVTWSPEDRGDTWILYLDGEWIDKITWHCIVHRWRWAHNDYESFAEAKNAAERANGIEVDDG